MGELTHKIKETLKGAKDTAVMAGENAPDKVKETTTTTTTTTRRRGNAGRIDGSINGV